MGHSLVLHPASQSQAGTYLGGRQNGKFPIVNIFCLSIEILDSYRRKTEFPNFICFPSKKLSISRCRINNLFTPLCLSFYQDFHLYWNIPSAVTLCEIQAPSVLTVACFCTYLEEPPLWATHLDISTILTAFPVKKEKEEGISNVAERCTHLFYR